MVDDLVSQLHVRAAKATVPTDHLRVSSAQTATVPTGIEGHALSVLRPSVCYQHLAGG